MTPRRHAFRRPARCLQTVVLIRSLLWTCDGLQVALRSLGFPCKKDEVRQLMRDVDVDGSNKVNFADFQSISTWAIRVWNGDCVGPKAMVCELMGSPAASVYRRLGSDRKVFGARPRGRNLQGKLASAAMVQRAGGSSNTCGSSLLRRDVQAFRLFDEDRTGKISLKVRTFMHPVAPVPPRARAVRAVLTHCDGRVCRCGWLRRTFDG